MRGCGIEGRIDYDWFTRTGRNRERRRAMGQKDRGGSKDKKKPKKSVKEKRAAKKAKKNK